MNLFNINQAYLDFVNQIIENGGEITPELEATLTFLGEERDEKLTNMAKLVKHLEGNNKLIDDEMSRLASVKQVNENIAKRMKEMIVDTLKLHDLRGKTGNWSHKVALYNLYTRHTVSTEVEDNIQSRWDINNENSLPSEIQDEVVSWNFNRKFHTGIMTELVNFADEQGNIIQPSEVLVSIDKTKAKEIKQNLIENLVKAKEALSQSTEGTPEYEEIQSIINELEETLGEFDFITLVEKDSLTIR